MKAAIYNNYGSPEVLRVTEIEQSKLKDDEIRIKIFATAVNSGDVRLRKADPFAVRLVFGLTKPKINILGSVYSGVVVELGKAVQHFVVGDEVFGHTDMHFGAYAEYLCVAEQSTVTLKSASISHEEAAVIPFGALTALHFIKKANIKAGQKMLVYGASGAVGTAAVQLAKYYGAEVTGVCSTGNIALLKSLGVDHVIDYCQEDFTSQEARYDIIFDAVNQMPIGDGLKVLDKKGLLILSAAGMAEMFKGLLLNMFSKRKVLMGVISHSKEEINFLANIIVQGKLKPVIDRSYALEQIVEAHQYVEKGHKKGNVALIVRAK